VFCFVFFVCQHQFHCHLCRERGRGRQHTLKSFAHSDTVEGSSGGGSLLLIGGLVLDAVFSKQAVPQPQLLVVNGRQILQQIINLGEHSRHAGLLGPNTLVKKRAGHLANTTIPVGGPLRINGVVGEHNRVVDVRVEGDLRKRKRRRISNQSERENRKKERRENAPWEDCPCSGS